MSIYISIYTSTQLTHLSFIVFSRKFSDFLFPLFLVKSIIFCSISSGTKRNACWTTHRVEDENGAELDQAVQGHVSEEAEGGDERTAALSANMRRENKVPSHCCCRGFILLSHNLRKQRSPSAPDEQRHTADVLRLGGERRSNWRLGFRQRHPDVSSSQGPAVIGPVPAHAHPVAAVTEERLD